MKSSTVMAWMGWVAMVTTPAYRHMAAAERQIRGVRSMELTSTAFRHMEPIPKKYTCEGENTSPPIAWTNVPAGTESLVLVVDDPDAPDPAAPKITYVHWLRYNIPPGTSGLAEGAGNRAPEGTMSDGSNSAKKAGYTGPCPPIGKHRYFHKLYALDIVLPDLGCPSYDGLAAAMKGHVLGEAVLIGTYRKSGK